MRKFFSALLILALLLCAAGFAEDGQNLLANSGFESSSDGLPDGWSRDMWYTDVGVSTLDVDPNGVSGACARVYNASDNDARFSQTVTVEPDTVYRLSAYIRAEGCDADTAGANLSIGNTFTRSDPVYDTNGEWQYVELYGQTGEDQTKMTVFLRVGGYSSECTGTAWFDDVELVKVDEVPGGAGLHSFATMQPSSGDDEEEDDEDAEPTRNTQFYLLFACIFVTAAVAVTRKARRTLPGKDSAYTKGFFAMMVCGLILRVILAVTIPGYNTDINCFSSWADTMASAGPFKFYSTVSWCDYPPLYMWLLGPVGLLRRLFGFAYRTGGALLLVKLWPIAFDLMTACLLWRKGRDRIGARPAMLLSMLILFNPAVFINSAAWGQIDSLLTFFLVLCALEACDGRYIRAMLAFAAAALVKPQALLLGPVGLVYLIARRVRAHMAHEEDAARDTLRCAGGILAALLALYIAALASTIGTESGLIATLVRPVTWLVEQYSGTLGGYSYMTVNALNLYCLLGLNWAKTDAHTTLYITAWVLMGIGLLYSLALTVKSRKPHTLPLTGALALVLVCTFGPMMHERYIYPALALLLFAYVYTRDRRVLVSAVVLSFTLFLNEVLVLQGGMTAANYGHLQSSEAWINLPVCAVGILNALFLAYTSFDICVRDHITELSAESEPLPDTKPCDYRLRLKRGEIIAMLIVTAVYSVVAFTNLGTMSAPQTYWQSGSAGEQVTFDLGETKSFIMTYYGNICNTNFTVELSNDGQTWTEPVYAQYAQGQVFRWLQFTPSDEENNQLGGVTEPTDDGTAYICYGANERQTARYVRIASVAAGLKLCEVGFLDEDGNVIPVQALEQSGEACVTDANLLLDEQDTVPATPSYYNSTYFDEIYHARTAYEHLHGMSTYEWTHPPLGKVMIMLGIQLFGMTPFGWRFSGALCGVLMLPLMYLLVKQLTHSRRASLIAMLLLSVDAMHFTQTRIATIDSFAVFTIMLMYLPMIRFTQMPWGSKKEFRKSLIPLGLCGVFMGIAWATKWIGLYASAGLAVMLFWTLARHIREALDAIDISDLKIARAVLTTLLFCCVFYILVPVVIYYFSYYWHLQSHGVKNILDMFSLDKVKIVVDLQKSMYRYHSGLSNDTHYFRSPWYQWPIIWWPMWYYSGATYVASDMVSSISCMGNPAVWWFGLVALLIVVGYAAWQRRAPREYTITVIGFCSQYLPWTLVPRSTFIYHYFASVPFIIIASVLVLEKVREENKRAFRICTGVLLAAALALFVMFYPLESGMTVPRSYAMLLRWFKWYNF